MLNGSFTAFRPGRIAPILGMAIALLAGGCSDGTPRLDPGCYLNGAVPGSIRRAVEKSADVFYEQLRSRQYEAAYAEAASQLRERVDKQSVALAWTSIAEVLTLPAEVATEEIAVVAVKPGDRGPRELACVDPADSSASRKMMATDQPLQAYLIQSGLVEGTLYNFASVWYHEGGKWRIATFGTKPRTVADHDWTWWRNLAREQQTRGNARNAALLYNLAMDLLVPAPWVRPDMLDQLMAEQRKIHPENLPNNRKERWVTLDDTEFFPFQAACDIVPGGVAVRFMYEVPDGTDSTAVKADAPKLVDFVRTTFPEYAEVFRAVRLEAVAAGTRQPVWAGEYPLQ
jgi:hypothetical protein